MDRTILERYDRRVPRYTSYPTAPHFHAGITADTYLRWLAAIGPESPLSLYFHVPFCHEMCWYCGCHTKIVRRYEPVGGYAATMAEEVKRELQTASVTSTERSVSQLGVRERHRRIVGKARHPRI